ncbi:MAG: TetR/AcrR family transcriptional regulator [Gemmatimonadetes bacterium]|nr:TetR/AcrR family transcriptional regulator [Gemmatimonadota bacterium]
MKTETPARRRTRDPEGTRERLIQCAFEEIHEHGYNGASLERILASSGVTKGALYHHFGSKADLAHAVIDHVIRPFAVDRWLAPLRESEDPISALAQACTDVMSSISDEEMCCGCPLNNLTQELANTDDAFREHLSSVYDEWRAGIREAFERGKRAGTVRADVDASGVAVLAVATVAGFATTAKSTRDRELTMSGGTVFLQFLESLRPLAASSSAA